MIMDVSWTMRRTGMVQYIDTVSWWQPPENAI